MSFTTSPDWPALESLSGLLPYQPFLEKVPIRYARDHRIVMCMHEDAPDQLLVLTDKQNTQRGDAIHTAMQLLDVRDITCRLLPEQQLEQAIDMLYSGRENMAAGLAEQIHYDIDEQDTISLRDDLLDGGHQAPVIQLVNSFLFDAVRQQASDVHVQPAEDQCLVRFRIDGVLSTAHALPKAMHAEVVSRIKIMGGMDIAERRLPQDGRVGVRIGSREVDLRLSTVPTQFGERAVIRLLDRGTKLFSLEELGMDPETLSGFNRMIHLDHGLVLVTGPTGSGKSTTLYAALQEIHDNTRNVLTLEDPIEYQLPGISQIQVGARKGMTFAKGLRSVLRQDPDIVMVGEIRDQETASLAIQAALTGHLVFSTLHTNDASSAVTRLLDLGIEPYLVASSLRAVLAQRLVRRYCSHCAAPMPDTQATDIWNSLNTSLPQPPSLLSATGCSKCRQLGYRGRVGIFEWLEVSPDIRHLILQRSSAADIKQQATRAGMRTLRADGLRKIQSGHTSPDEVLRTTSLEAEEA